jgi:hypothetical protein
VRHLLPSDLMPREEYEARREELRRLIIAEKAKRRVPIGEHCTVHFESDRTMLYQVHEMLRAEGTWGQTSAVTSELEAYNPLIPATGELSATIMFEYETARERAAILPRLVGIDRHVWLLIGETPPRQAILDREQIDEAKVSSVQYAKWTLSPEQRVLLKEEGTVVRLRIDHPAYQAQAVVAEETRLAIMDDPD